MGLLAECCEVGSDRKTCPGTGAGHVHLPLRLLPPFMSVPLSGSLCQTPAWSCFCWKPTDCGSTKTSGNVTKTYKCGH